MIKCGECGYENMDGLDYCDGCGAKLNAAAASEHAGAAAGGADASAPAASAAPSGEAAAMSAPAAESTPAAAHTDGGAAADGGAEAAGTPASQPAPSSEAPTGEIQKPAEATPAAEPQPAATAAAATFKAKLSILRGGRKGQEFELEVGNNQIGRWDPETGAFPEVDLDQDDPEAKVSRKHALVRIDSGKITVEDTGSLNGTYVNRQPRLIPGTPIELKNGDEIIIGKTFLRLVIEPIS